MASLNPAAATGRLQRVLSRPLHTRSFGIVIGLAITSLVLVALLHVWVRLEVIRIGYALSEQTRLHQALLQHNQRLRLELATRKDPATIERIARDRLHMAPPDSSAIYVLSASGSSGPGRRAPAEHPAP